MAHTDKKTDTPSPEWWKHLKPFNKRKFYKKLRQRIKKYIREEND